jgi:hypothetical protein
VGGVANKIQSVEKTDTLSNGSLEKCAAPSDIAISRSPEKRKNQRRDFATMVNGVNSRDVME